MFKSKTRERKIFTSRKRIRQRKSGFLAIASLALLLIMLELLTRIFIDLSGNRSKFAQTQTDTNIAHAYQLDFLSARGSVKPDSDSTTLQAEASVSVGYELLGNQQTEYYQINSAGFRDRNPVPQAKPQGEVRIFLLGGSTAFGYGTTDDDSTISAYLEKRLQQRLQQQQTSPDLYQPDLLPFDKVERQKYLAKPARLKPGNYQVINASVPGYASGNELAQVALEILKYKPDLIVVLDGYEDLMLPSDLEAVQPPLLNPEQKQKLASLGDRLDKVIQLIEDKSYLAQVLHQNWLNSKDGERPEHFIIEEKTSRLVRHLPQDSDELQKRITRYIEHQKQILSLSAAAQIPLIVALQPEITGRNPSQLTEQEGTIATELGRTYIKQVKESYPRLIQAVQQLATAFPKNMKVVDLYKLTDRYPSPSFIDPIHLNSAANQKVAEQLYYAISNMAKMQLVPTQALPPKSYYRPIHGR